ncbi:MAG: replication initiator protein [Chaetfec virus UA24_2231]|nr:MAG: replication initiator protein [Chaetfec virus UA24_2231]
MACAHPLWIRNRRYYDPKDPKTSPSSAALRSDHLSSLALRPWDISRQYILVPCGKCDDCLRRLRNDWFVRLERELARCKAEHSQAVFITITINPRYYERALENPSSFVRIWNERVRHKLGHSFKHAFFQEFGVHPSQGSEPRLHFHGFLFGTNCLYNEIRSAVSDLGFVWLTKATTKRARYCVKYVVKQIGFDAELIKDKYVTYDGKPTKLSSLLQHRRYTRKFISAGVGDYLGSKRAPSVTTSSWAYMDSSTGVVYNYSIPRYYNRYLQQKDEYIRAIRSAFAYAYFSPSALVRRVVDLCVEKFLSPSALSCRTKYNWEMKTFRRFMTSGYVPNLDPPVWLNRDIVQFWYDEYGLNLIL